MRVIFPLNYVKLRQSKYKHCGNSPQNKYDVGNLQQLMHSDIYTCRGKCIIHQFSCQENTLSV